MRLDRLTIMLPWPDKSLMPNRKNGRHWGNTQAVKVKARRDAYLATKSALGTHKMIQVDRYPMRITFVAPDRIRRDWDNLASACKASYDGIAHALGIDDSLFLPVTVDKAVDPEKHGFVIVEIGE